MSKLSKYGILISGILSPLAALLLYAVVYAVLLRFSSDPQKDWRFRLAVSTLVMTVPFLVTLALAIRARSKHALSVSSQIGLAIAFLSLGLAWKPVSDGITRSKQSRNLAMHDVPAPPFATVDIFGKTQRLADHRGEVVLVNIWASWCGPCRLEMPKLDRLYREHAHQGLIVFGLSDEGVDVKRKFVNQVSVSYPLLTVSDGVPSFYRDIAQYPSLFLIDRQGRLQPAPGPDQPFDKVEASVDALLNTDSK